MLLLAFISMFVMIFRPAVLPSVIVERYNNYRIVKASYTQKPTDLSA